jgi:hypothetical protein
MTATETIFSCLITNVGSTLTITADDKNGRPKTLTLELSRLDDVDLTRDEYASLEIVRRMSDINSVGRGHLVNLKSIADKIAGMPTLTAAIARTAERTAVNNVAGVYRGEALSQANGVEKMAASVETLKGTKFAMLVYDIPTHKNDVCPNPSGLLWKHGFRMNLSCWVMPMDRLTHPDVTELLNLWTANGIVNHVVEYAESQNEKIRAIAQTKLEEEIRRLHTSLIETLGNATDAYNAAVAQLEAENLLTPKAEDIANSRRISRWKQILKESGERLNAAVACAELFDDTMNLSDLIESVRAAVDSAMRTNTARMNARR